MLPLSPTLNPDLSTQILHPFADTFVQKTKKLYLDTRTQRNLNKLTQVRSC